MNLRYRCAGIVTASLLAFSGCGGDDDGGSDTPDSGSVAADASTADATPEPDAPTALTGLDAVCDAETGPYPALLKKALSCNFEFVFIRLLGTDVLEPQVFSEFCEANFASVVDSGMVTIDDSKIAACLAYIDSHECPELDIDNLGGTPCDEIFVGTVAVGDDCDISTQCVGDAHCVNTNTSPAFAGGPQPECDICEARRATGATCTSDEQCSNGVCNGQNECAPAAGVDGACTDSNDCSGSLRCDGNFCVPDFASAGDACQDDDGCGFPFGMYCKFPTPLAQFSGIPTGICEPLPAVGEACVLVGQNFNEPACNIVEYHWCDEGVCAAPEISTVGQPCNIFPVIGHGARQCGPGLGCSALGEVGECLVMGSIGDSCSTDGPQAASARGGGGIGSEPCHPFYDCRDDVCSIDDSQILSGMCPAP